MFKAVLINISIKISLAGEKNVIRLCTFKSQNQDTCALARSKLQKTNDDVVQFCGTCEDNDGCNSGNQMKLFYPLVIFGTILSTVLFFV